MLKSLYIKNFTLIDELEVCFDKGLNVITGETGSGKSILIDAIDLAFGARSSKEQIKTGEKKALIELQLQLSESFPLALLEQNGIDIEDDNILILSREITPNSTRSRMNGVMVTQNYIQEVKSYLIDIHSQHQTYSYMQPKTHIDLLDNYGNGEHKGLLGEYIGTYKSLVEKKKKYESYKNESLSVEQKIDFLKFQIEEIEVVNIEAPTELEELNEELSKLSNAEELKGLTYTSYHALYGEDNSIIDVLNSLENKLIRAAEYDKNLSEIADTIADSSEALKDAASELRNYSESLDINEQRLAEVEERIAILEKLKRKYGRDLAEVLQSLETFKAELADVTFGTEQIEVLEQEIKELNTKAKNLSDALSTSRAALAQKLSGLIHNELVKLEMPKVKFKINLENKSDLTPKGADDVEFLISTNPGEPLKPIAKVASGGEIARVMLAIKTVFAKSDGINTVIFDEIDSGISGKVSQAVAEELANLATSHQIICITHQSIIAAMADNHFYVEKTHDETSTRSSIRSLDKEEELVAISKLASGSESKDSIDFASKLLTKSNEYKAKLSI